MEKRFTPLRLFATWTLAVAWVLALAACSPKEIFAPPYFRATDISLDSPADGWAVGYWITPNSSPQVNADTPAMAHLQHGQWRLAPKSVTANLIGYDSYALVRMLSPTDGWVATTNRNLYHFDGVRWSLAFPHAGLATQSITITDLALLSPDIGWAVGPDGILQYSQGVWKNVTHSLPPRAELQSGIWDYPGLRSVVIVSPTDAWAMGDGGLIWHYDGAHWRVAASPYFPNRYYTSESVDGFSASDTLLAHFARDASNKEALYASQMLSPTEGWAVGGAIVGSNPIDWGPAVVERYQDGSWRIAHIVIHTQHFGDPVFYSVAMTSMQDGWIGGAWVHSTPVVRSGDADPGDGPPAFETLLLHYHAGQWAFVAAPNVGALHRVVMVSPDEGWAEGDGGLLHYMNGKWQVAQVTAS